MIDRIREWFVRNVDNDWRVGVSLSLVSLIFALIMGGIFFVSLLSPRTITKQVEVPGPVVTVPVPVPGPVVTVFVPAPVVTGGPSPTGRTATDTTTTTSTTTRRSTTTTTTSGPPTTRPCTTLPVLFGTCLP